VPASIFGSAIVGVPSTEATHHRGLADVVPAAFVQIPERTVTERLRRPRGGAVQNNGDAACGATWRFGTAAPRRRVRPTVGRAGIGPRPKAQGEQGFSM